MMVTPNHVPRKTSRQQAHKSGKGALHKKREVVPIQLKTSLELSETLLHMQNSWHLVHVFVCRHYVMNSVVCRDSALSNGVQSSEKRGIFHLTNPIFEPYNGFSLKVALKAKQSHCRPGQAQRVPGSQGSQISWKRHKMVVGCQPYAPAAFTPRKFSWYAFLLEVESTPAPQCDRKDFILMKNPLTPAGIEPATLPFVAQHLNHRATAAL